MKMKMFAAALCVCAASAGSAFAGRADFPMAAKVSVVMMKPGEMKMVIKMSPADMAIIHADMKGENDVCKVQPAISGETNEMVLYCSEDELVAPGG